jgi:hypothetical protein
MSRGTAMKMWLEGFKSPANYYVGSQQEQVRTSEGEEAKEADFIDGLLGVVNLGKETIMWIRAHTVKSTGNLGSERVGDISGLDDATGSPDFESQEQEPKDDTSSEDILVGRIGELDVGDTH